MDLFDLLNVYCGFCGGCPEVCPCRPSPCRPEPPCFEPCQPTPCKPPPKPCREPCYAYPYKPRRFLYADCPDCPPPKPPKPCPPPRPQKPDPCLETPCDRFPYPCDCAEAFPPVFPPCRPRCPVPDCDCPFARPSDCCREFCFRWRIVRR